MKALLVIFSNRTIVFIPEDKMARSPDPEQEQLNPPTLLMQIPGAGHTSSAHSSISENH